MAEAIARLDVGALIQQALENKAGVEQLERLVALAKDLRAEQAREAWYAAMADFQRLCPVIKKSATAKIATSRASYSYSYAPLDEILSTVQPVMGPLGLSISWRSRVDTNAVIVACRVAHKHGHYEESGDMAIPIVSAEPERGANAAQRVGVATTYARRYALLGIIGMAPEDDDDGGSRAVTPPEKPEDIIKTLRVTAPAAVVEDSIKTMRDQLLVQIGDVADAAGWSAAARRKLWQEHFGDANPTTVEPAHLADFLAEVRRLTS